MHTSTLPIPPVITSWSLIHTATFQLFSCYEVLMLNTSRNVTTSWWSRFTATFLRYIFHDISSCRPIHTATFPLSTMLHLHVDQCIPQLFHFLLCYNFIVIITYRNFSTSSLLGCLCGPVIKWVFGRLRRKTASRGREDTRVWYRETMFSQMVS